MRHWGRKRFALQNGCLRWVPCDVVPEGIRRALEWRLADMEDLEWRRIDFSQTSCEVVELTRGRVALRPTRGCTWHKQDAHRRAGTDEAIELGLTSVLDGRSLLEALQEHIAYGQAAREERTRRRMQLMGLREVSPVDLPEDCPGACSVCLEDLREGPVTVTYCQHYFHTRCVQRWAMQCARSYMRPTCPCCRQALTGGHDGCCLSPAVAGGSPSSSSSL